MKSAADTAERGMCSALFVAQRTRARSGSRNGSALKSTPSTTLYTDAVAPMAIASVRIAEIENTGLAVSRRIA